MTAARDTMSKDKLVFFIDANTRGTCANIDQADALLTLLTHQTVLGTSNGVKDDMVDTDITALQ
jgi:hypothetical protein